MPIGGVAAFDMKEGVISPGGLVSTSIAVSASSLRRLSEEEVSARRFRNSLIVSMPTALSGSEVNRLFASVTRITKN
jgi:RNA-splicing ligase RtcB